MARPPPLGPGGVREGLVAYANKWNRAEAVTLPICGQEVLLRRVDKYEIEYACIAVTRLQHLVDQLTGEDGAREPTEEHLRTLNAALDTLARLCLVRPVVVLSRAEVSDDDEQVYIGDLPRGDKLYMVYWLGGEEVGARAESFPDGAGSEAAAVDAVPDGEGGGAAAVAPGGVAS